MADEPEDFGINLDEAADLLGDLPPLEDDGNNVDEGEAPEPEGDEEEPEEGEDSEPSKAAIDAPASLNAEEKARFAQLPQEAQRMLADVETRRARQVTEATTNAANAQRTAKAEAASTVAAATEKHAAQLNALVTAYAPRQPNPADYGNDMQAYARDHAQWQYASGEHAKLVQQVQAIAGDGQQMSERQRAEWAQGEQQKLRTSLPDWFDAEKGPALKDELTSVGADLGYGPEQMAAADASDLLALNKALQWKRDSTKLKAIMDRQMQGVRAAKRTTTPGVQQPQGQARRQAGKDASARLAKSGSLEDAAAALAAQLK